MNRLIDRDWLASIGFKENNLCIWSLSTEDNNRILRVYLPPEYEMLVEAICLDRNIELTMKVGTITRGDLCRCCAVIGLAVPRDILLHYPAGSGKLAETLIYAYNSRVIELAGLVAICKSMGPEWEAMYADLKLSE